MLGEFHNGARIARRRGRCCTPPLPTPLQPPQMQPSVVQVAGERLDQRAAGRTTAALRAGRRLRARRDLLPALRRWLWAIAVAAPRRQGRAIAGPLRREMEMNHAPAPTEVGTARLEQAAGLPRVGPRGSDFSDFRLRTVRGRAALAEKALPPAAGCATRAHRRGRGCLAPRHWCWGRERRLVDHAALRPTSPGRLARGLQARLP